jgi:predicted dehydrogenase/threonine dehydrogenase-like Zn-dependent dehydrogenase
MHQIIQDLKSGETLLEEVPTPRVGSGKVLIKTHRSLVSLGTEKMLVSFGQANLLQKARQQPERGKQVIDKMKSDGIRPTIETVFRKLGTPLPLGYSQAGEVIAVGKEVSEFQVGDRVISNGNHAEIVAVPRNLVAPIPDNVSYDEACFTVVSSIGLQGIRLIDPTFDETVVVLGLGLIGLISAQLLQANGCNVIGIDLDPSKVKIAQNLGINAINSANFDPVKFIENQTDNVGADAVLITASTTSNTVISQAAQMSRKRGRVVLVGVIGLDIDRADFYEKEISFQVSCSYGPGRYDTDYEDNGIDYPLPFVRWTEKRNFESVLNAISKKLLDVQSLITEKVALSDFNQIYGDMKNTESIASILEYPIEKNGESAVENRTISLPDIHYSGGKNGIAIIGAGNFTSASLLPALKNTDAQLKYIVSSGGLSSTTLAKKHNIPHSSTDYKAVLEDDDISAVIITTRHNLHSDMSIAALKAGKQVFVEKPLALNIAELDKIIDAVEKTGNSVTVGFNRRFSPHTLKIRETIGEDPDPMNVIATMNAGHIPQDMWVQDMKVGGGRIIGEACHHIDLITYITGSKVISVQAQSMGKDIKENSDNVSIHVKYENGSLGVLNYFSNGNKGYSKERLEIYYQEKNLIMDNFRKLYAYGYKTGFLSNKLLSTSQDKGHKKQFELFIDFVSNGGNTLIPFDEIVNTTRATFAAIESLKQGKPVKID